MGEGPGVRAFLGRLNLSRHPLSLRLSSETRFSPPSRQKTPLVVECRSSSMRLAVVPFVAALALAPLSALAQENPVPTQGQESPVPGAAPEVSALQASGPISLDGSLDEPSWANAGEVPFLTQQDPKPGAPTPFERDAGARPGRRREPLFRHRLPRSGAGEDRGPHDGARRRAARRGYFHFCPRHLRRPPHRLPVQHQRGRSPPGRAHRPRRGRPLLRVGRDLGRPRPAHSGGVDRGDLDLGAQPALPAGAHELGAQRRALRGPRTADSALGRGEPQRQAPGPPAVRPALRRLRPRPGKGPVGFALCRRPRREPAFRRIRADRGGGRRARPLLQLHARASARS